VIFTVSNAFVSRPRKAIGLLRSGLIGRLATLEKIFALTSRYDTITQGSGTYGSRARCGYLDDGIWLAWYFLTRLLRMKLFL